ncbi:transporter [Agarivorans gilvus]|uniref:Transporter n=1 Tax=Agarivorans gilvus TaxID=680279 RepID=A0ABQ1HWG1_9ALTE|nr:CDF family Co(II)/Ni(II) efflux transporter DmeF [Agarivorans gilvus]GGA91931.1 transporter [Agarivorans gilvus]
MGFSDNDYCYVCRNHRRHGLWLYGSMALLADGWHMGTHAAAFCITLFAYRYSQKHANNDRFSFGTGKVSVLGGYTSAIALGLVALVMLVESAHRLFNPQLIQFDQAILVAIIGFVVNGVSMWLLHDHHHEPHHSEHQHHSAEPHHHHDHNLQAAYFHVLADALTSVLAIVALLFGKYQGWTWLDPIMGAVGASVIAKWTFNLLKQTSPILLDESIDADYCVAVKQALSKTAKVTDLHIWKVSANNYSAAIAIQDQANKSFQDYQRMLQKFDKIDHLTLEVQPLSK